MAGLKWIRLETTMFENPKLLYLKEDKQYKTIVVHLEAMTYSGRHSLAGFVPKAALRVIGATMADANRLVAAALWTPAPGGWDINGWEEFQLANDEALRRSEKAKKAAAARWANRNGKEFIDA
ncbi:hypothetical protein [Mycobacterium avium]|uniref:hypothetical protein n=1 Tax=Mycobacterium avium TaxID=1764 RepID=UPI000CE39DB0|nr:hypothetical protein [Mycobacterium avium]